MSLEVLPVVVSGMVVIGALVIRLYPLIKARPVLITKAHRIVAHHVVRKLHHITATDAVNVAVLVDISARMAQSAALAAIVASVSYLLVAALWHEV